MSILEVKNVKKVYTTRFGSVKVQALSNVNFSVEEGEYVAIMGESGSGKTTLLNILASLDKATSGQVLLRGQNISGIKQKELCAFRREHLGFVFQEFNLLDSLSLKDNIFLPMVLSGNDYGEMERRLVPLAGRLMIDDVLEKYPYEVSGGQKQRAAACRALITKPDLVLADEPTGALDSRASGKLLKLFEEINAEGQTILMVTHSVQAASYAGRVLFIKDGCVYHQIYRGNQSKDSMYRMISDALTVMQTETQPGGEMRTETRSGGEMRPETQPDGKEGILI
ncbi:MAG: ABC transporter ATP-binding protein [Lachnospiraceae bacterium]|nr:ABC transporter ATP-binding protein [Lachnospiraceae bacterium]